MAKDIIKISERRPQRALAALNRLTGIEWDGLPLSLKDQVIQPDTGMTENRRETEGTGLRRAGS